jgi:hypothetical protein
MPLDAVVLALLVVVDKSGVSLDGAGSSFFTVEVDVDLEDPLIKGARCVSFNSAMFISHLHRSTNPAKCTHSWSVSTTS